MAHRNVYPMSINQPTTIRELILKSGKQFGAAEFIKAAGRSPMIYSKFKAQYDYVESTLRDAGITADSQVAVKIPGGPEFASCLLCVMASAVCVPINADISEQELGKIVMQLHLAAVVLTAEEAESRAAFWSSCDIKIIVLSTQRDDVAGQFTLSVNASNSRPKSRSVVATDVALILLTSGTTGFPKHAMHTQSSLVFTAIQSSQFFKHTQDDCGLAIMPLNHGQGMFVALLPVPVSGSSIVCGTSMNPEHFFDLYEAFKPTWFTAIPTFYHALLRYASSHSVVLGNNQLRYIRTGSAAMSSDLMRDVASFFGKPVLMGYGSAESCHITNNPVPPGINKPGSVGVPYGNEVAIMDQAGLLLERYEIGEVVVRGSQLTSGYFDNLNANAELFVDDWLRTGDLGKLDKDGYLTLLGRTKEQINRGGESISPLEIEESIRSHPSVIDVAVFAVEHPTLGEDIAAAIVAKNGELDERTLKHFLSALLSVNKIPHEVLFIAELPLTNVGKVDKKNLATMLTGLKTSRQKEQSSIYPRSDLEVILERIWSEVLNVPSVGVTDLFLDLGGDSLLAQMIINRINTEIRTHLDVSSLFFCSTIAEQAQLINSSTG